MEGVLGFTTLFAGNFAPKSWALCQGQTISIQSNTALYSLLGTFYGGNGTTNFKLPDLQGRAIVGVGQGPGLSDYLLGQVGGAEAVTVTDAQMPAHVHPVQVTVTQNAAGAADSTNPENNTYGNEGTGESVYSNPANVALKPFAGTITMQNAGIGAPVPTVNPYIALNYIICQYGIYPARS
jgi:microcystin-dependent protein